MPGIFLPRELIERFHADALDQHADLVKRDVNAPPKIEAPPEPAPPPPPPEPIPPPPPPPVPIPSPVAEVASPPTTPPPPPVPESPPVTPAPPPTSQSSGPPSLDSLMAQAGLAPPPASGGPPEPAPSVGGSTGMGDTSGGAGSPPSLDSLMRQAGLGGAMDTVGGAVQSVARGVGDTATAATSAVGSVLGGSASVPAQDSTSPPPLPDLMKRAGLQADQTAVTPPTSSDTLTNPLGTASTSDTHQSQFAMGLSDDQAYAACGPAAAIGFARKMGRNPTSQEAMQLASAVGWTPAQGMAGVASEQALLQKMGIATRLEQGDQLDWSHVTRDAMNKNPVILDTPGHYLFVDDARVGPDGVTLYHIGTSGTDLRGGAGWETRAQIEGHGVTGTVRGALYADNPNSPHPSVANTTSSATPTTAGISGGGNLAGKIGEAGQQILSQGAQAAGWLGDQGQKALQAVLVTEGGLNKARGDNGQSAGPLQFFEGGQLANIARDLGIGLEQAKTWVEDNPIKAVQWAIGTRDAPGYLGAAIADGIRKGLSGADLATYAQQHGQVSVSPERAGANYSAMFGGGQSVVASGVNPNVALASSGGAIAQQGTDLINATKPADNSDILAPLEREASQRLADLQKMLGTTENAPTAKAPAPLDMPTMGGGLAGRSASQVGMGNTPEEIAASSPPTSTSSGADALSTPPQDEQNPLQKFGQQLTDSIVGMVKHLTGPQPMTAAEQPTPSDTLTNPTLRPIDPSKPLPPATPMGPTELSGPERFVRSVESPGTGNPLVDVPGTAASVVGTAAHGVGDVLEAVSVASRAAETIAGSDQWSTEYAARGGRDLQAEMEDLARRSANGEQGLEPRIQEIGDQLNAINKDIAGGERPHGQALELAAERNPNLPALKGVANLAAAGVAAPLAAEGAPLVARAIAEVLAPGTNPGELLSQARELVSGAHFASPEVAVAVEKAFSDFGTRMGATADERAAQVARMDDGGRGLLEKVHDYLTSPEFADTLRSRQRGEVAVGRFTTDRFYHGTGGAFDQPDAAKFEDGLFGPGYYLTDRPEVAGGIVKEGGDSLTLGYADRAGNGGVSLDMPEALAKWRQRLANATTEVDRVAAQAGVTALEDRIAQARTGANVRAVDVPQDLKLLDLDHPRRGEVVRVAQGLKAGLGDTAPPLLDGVIDQVSTIYRDFDWMKFMYDSPGVEPAAVNKALAQMGYDGIRYGGGRIMPMADSGGKPILHNVNVIFPESLDKLRNAISGTQGGGITPTYATDIAGAAAGGTAGNQSTPDNASPLERGARIGAGALGGGLVAHQLATSGLRQRGEFGIPSRPPRVGLSAQELADTLARYPEDTRAGLRDFVKEQTDAGLSGKAINDTLREWVRDNPLNVEPATREVSNPFALVTKDRATLAGTPLSQDEILSHADHLEQVYQANDEQIRTLESRLEAGVYKPSGKGDLSGSVVRPPWGVGWTNDALRQVAQQHDVNPYQPQWWEKANLFGIGRDRLSSGREVVLPPTGEFRENVGQSGLRGTGQTKQTATEARSELARLQAEQHQIMAAVEHISATAGNEPLYRAEQATAADLPWEYTVPSATTEPISARAAEPTSAAARANTPGGPETTRAAPPGTAAATEAQPAATALATDAPATAAQPSTDALQGLIDMARQRGYDTKALEEQLPPRAAPPTSPPPPSPPTGTATPPPPTGAPKPVSLLELFNAAHVGNIISGTSTATHVLVNSILSPAWSGVTRTLADIGGAATLGHAPGAVTPSAAIGRIQGRGIGVATGLAQMGDSFLAGIHDFYNEPHNIANRVGNPVVAGLLRAQQATGSAFHAALQNMAMEGTQRMELAALAGEDAAARGFTGSAFANHIAQVLQNPSLLPSALEKAQEVGRRASLRADSGTLQQMAQRAAQVPFAGNLLFPVVKIAAQSLAQGIEKSPLGLVGTAVDVGRFALAKAGHVQPGTALAGPYARTAADILGTGGLNRIGARAGRGGQPVTPLGDRLTNNVVGTAVTALLASKALDGSITGNGPADPDELKLLQAKGWRPHSIFVPGLGYVDYHVLGALAVPLSIAGNYADAINYPNRGTGPDAGTNPNAQPTPEEIAADMSTRVASYLADSTGLRAMGDLYKTLHGGAGAAAVPAQFFGGMLSGLVPESGLLKSAVVAADTAGERAPKSGDIGDVIRQGLPPRTPLIGGRDQVPLKLDVEGRTIPNEQAGLGALLSKRGDVSAPTVGGGPGGGQGADPLINEVLRLRIADLPVALTAPQTKNYMNAAQTPEQESLIAKTVGQAVRLFGLTTMASPQYAGLTDPQKADALSKALAQAHQAANITLGGQIARDPHNSALLQWLQTPQYFGVRGTPDEIARQNFQIAEAKSKLSAYTARYGERGEFKMRADDPAAYKLSQRERLDSEVLTRTKKKLDEITGGALLRSGNTAAAGGFVGVGSTVYDGALEPPP